MFSTINKIIQSITYSKLVVTFAATEDLSFDEPYLGGIYRDCMLDAFMKLVCIMNPKPICEKCPIRFDCIYYKFSTNELRAPHALFGRKTFPPKSYILNPLPDPKNGFRKGAKFGFELILIGDAIEQFAQILADVFRKMGEIGIGNGRRKFKPIALKYYNKLGKLKPLPAIGLPVILKLADLEVKPINSRIRLHFETPVRFLSENKEVEVEPTFGEFIKRLYIRLGDLACLYCKYEKFDFENETKKFNFQVQCTHNELERNGFLSPSTNRTKLGIKSIKEYKGHVGKITFNGDISPWAKLLSVGEITHVGSAATFGLGKYRILGNE